MEEAERLRISIYFRKIMKLVSKEILAKKLVSKNDLYQLFQLHSASEEIVTSPFYMKYKFTEKSLPKVTMQCEFISLKMPLKISLRGCFRVIASRKKKNKLVAKKFHIEEF